MTTHIRFRRGFKNDLPSYAPSGMPMWCEDTQELYLGTGTGLVQVGGGRPLLDEFPMAVVGGYIGASCRALSNCMSIQAMPVQPLQGGKFVWNSLTSICST